MSEQIGQARIKVVGVGGAGCNMVNWLYQKGIQGADVIACNTDKLHLDIVNADKKLLLGKDTTKGLGAGGYPEKGKDATLETITPLKDEFRKVDMMFVCAGMGGGTGTGGAPVIAKIGQDAQAIVIGTVTMPFKVERARIDRAEFGLKQLQEYCDTVIVIDNNRLVQLAGNLPVQQAFAVANELVATMIRGIVEIISVPSLVNLDYADVKSIMSEGGVAAIGIGFADGSDRVKTAVSGALNNPLLDITYDNAHGAIIHIEGGPDMTLDQVAEAGEMITKNMDADANVIWGARVNPALAEKISVMTIMVGVKSPYMLAKTTKIRTQKEKERDYLELDVL
ncbi:cell division protein FtsZ [Candidatus Woesearchaeota archaeon]|nr:cell division protein FtsZ [Candidatus Woesearchaeota archaeon]